MALKSFDQIVDDMIAYIRTKKPSLDTSVGSVTRDAFIEPPANEMESMYAELEHVSLIHSLFYQEQMSTTELDRLVYNWGLTRNPADTATGVASFRRNSIPTTDIVIPLGTIVTTQKGTITTPVRFQTTEEKTMYVATGASYYNPFTGYYEIDVPVEAIEAGTDGNVSAGAIIVLESSVTGISSVYNITSTTGGTEQEDNASLADRALLSLTGNNVGTADGYETTVRTNEYVNDAIVVGPGDPLMTRDSGLGVKVDIYVQMAMDLLALATQTTQTYTYTDLSGGGGATDPANDKILSKQPVKAIVKVEGTVTSPFPSSSYELILDTYVYAHSTSANDKLHWRTNAPTPGEVITITYTYYSIMETLQALIDANRSITADVLVKYGTEVKINYELTVYGDSTITDAAAFKSAIETAISNYINVNALGQKVEQSDIVAAIYDNVPGTDRIVLPFTRLEAPSKGIYGVADITLARNEYPRVGSIHTVTVVLAS